MVRLNGTTPVKYGMRLNSEAKYLELKEQLNKLCGIPAHRLLLAEIAYSQIRHILTDDSRINPMTATELYAYELPEDKDEEEFIEDEQVTGELEKKTSLFVIWKVENFFYYCHILVIKLKVFT